MSDELMVLKLINEINGKLKFFFRKNKFLTSKPCGMLCNALIQRILTMSFQLGTQKKTEKKVQIMQNKCMRFCLRLDKIHHIFLIEFRSIH